MWSKGIINGYEYWVKHFDEGSEFGINGGRISKLAIRDQQGRWLVNYDRGWDQRPTKEVKPIYDKLIEMGVYFIWYFHYMPVGNDASPELLPTPEQRIEAFHRIRKFRAEKPLFAMDFQNDGEYVGGCIAGGRRYLHINANGDVDPCVFIHYSDSNIREKTLLEALQGPIFMAYHDGQPFNENHLRPCPMLENPELLRDMVEKTGAHSTDLQSPESADHLCAKCDAYAEAWRPTAEILWKQRVEERAAAKAAVAAK